MVQNQIDFVAMVDKNNTLIIFKLQYNQKNILRGFIQQFLPQFREDIITICWVRYSDHLAIQTKSGVEVYDFHNEKIIHAFKIEDELTAISYFERGYLLESLKDNSSVQTNLRLVSYEGDVIWDEIQLSNYRLQSDAIITQSQILDFKRQELELRKRSNPRISGRIRKTIENENAIKLGQKILFNSNEISIPHIPIPKSLHHRLLNSDFLTVETLPDGFIILGTELTLIALQNNEIKDTISFNSAKFQFLNYFEHSQQYFIQIDNIYYVIFWKSSKLVFETLGEFFVNHNLNLVNLPPYFQIDLTIDSGYRFQNYLDGYLCYPDFDKKYLFYDLYTNQAISLSNIEIDNNSHIYISHNGKHLLNWKPARKFPFGTLILYDLTIPNSNKFNIIYELHENVDQNDEIAGNPLVIPSWSIIDCSILLEKKYYSVRLSLSGLYLILENSSKSLYVDNMDFHEYELKKVSYFKFGDLRLQSNTGEILLNGISPILDFDETNQLICFTSIDGYTYIQDLNQPVPIFSLPIKLPYVIKILESGEYVVILSFGVKEDRIKTTSKGKLDKPTEILTQFPRLFINIIAVGSKKNFKKSIRFPTHLFDTNQLISINQVQSLGTEVIEITIPSYIDNLKQLKINFNLSSNKFSRINEHKQKRYWQSNQIINPRKKPKYGSEFIEIENPEIKRHLMIKPSYLEDRKVFRKKDKQILASANTIQKTIPQLSTSTLYNRIEKIPFTIHLRGKERIIYLEEINAKLIENEEFKLLDKSKTHPLYYSVSTDELLDAKIDRVRLEQFLEQLISSNAVHKLGGIYFSSDEKEAFIKELQSFLKKIMN